MLTSEAIENREWGGLRILRHLLKDRRASFVGGFYPTSISDSMFDEVRRAAVTGSLIDAERDALLIPSALATLSPGDQEELLRELEAVSAHLRGIGGLFERIASQVEDVRREASPVIAALRRHSGERSS